MSKLEDNLNKIFDLPETEVQTISVVDIVHVEEHVENEFESDFDSARKNIKNIMNKGEEALDGILFLAKTSEHPRSYEVVGQIMKTMIDANKDLLNLHKQKKELQNKNGDSNTLHPQNVTNALFVGSTTDLQKYIKEKRNVE